MQFLSLFNPRYKLTIHIIQIVLIVAAMGCSAPRIFLKGQPRTRANTIALGMGAKSLVFIAYQLLTEHLGACKRWASKKANLILNGMEPIFWGAVAFLVMQGNLNNCNGVGCYLGWVVVGLSVPLNMLAGYQAIVSWVEWREYKASISGRAPPTEGDTLALTAANTKYQRMDVEQGSYLSQSSGRV